MSPPRLLCSLALPALFLAACSTNAPAANAVKPASQRRAAPNFELKDADGQTVKLSDYRGKVVLLNFWATWCGPCKIEIPWFIDFETRYKDRGFAVLGVAMDDEGWEIVRPYLEAKKVNYRVVIGNDRLATLYGGVESLPTTFLIDREGKIASVHVGLVSKSEYANDIQQLLQAATSDRSAAGADPALLARAD